MRAHLTVVLPCQEGIQKIVERRISSNLFERKIYYRNGICLELVMDFTEAISKFVVSSDNGCICLTTLTDQLLPNQNRNEVWELAKID